MPELVGEFIGLTAIPAAVVIYAFWPRPKKPSTNAILFSVFVVAIWLYGLALMMGWAQ